MRDYNICNTEGTLIGVVQAGSYREAVQYAKSMFPKQRLFVRAA